MPRDFRKSDPASRETWEGKHRREHWYRDSTAYFITARVRDGLHVFHEPACQEIFWTKFAQYTREADFEPWIASLMVNHYHVVGFAKIGSQLGEMMRKLHGSVAWLVSKHLKITHKPFWKDSAANDYMDGCLRDIKQLEDSYRYVQTQSVRARVVKRWQDDPNTKTFVDLEMARDLATQRNALMTGVSYPRYERRNHSQRS